MQAISVVVHTCGAFYNNYNSNIQHEAAVAATSTIDPFNKLPETSGLSICVAWALHTNTSEVAATLFNECV